MLGAILGPGARMLDAPPDPCLSTAHHACASEGLSRKRGGAAPSSMRVGRGGGEQIYSMSRGGRPGGETQSLAQGRPPPLAPVRGHTSSVSDAATRFVHDLVAERVELGRNR